MTFGYWFKDFYAPNGRMDFYNPYVDIYAVGISLLTRARGLLVAIPSSTKQASLGPDHGFVS